MAGGGTLLVSLLLAALTAAAAGQQKPTLAVGRAVAVPSLSLLGDIKDHIPSHADAAEMPNDETSEGEDTDEEPAPLRRGRSLLAKGHHPKGVGHHAKRAGHHPKGVGHHVPPAKSKKACRANVFGDCVEPQICCNGACVSAFTAPPGCGGR